MSVNRLLFYPDNLSVRCLRLKLASVTVLYTHLCVLRAPKQNAEFDWSEKLQGHILGAFYYGYAIAHIPGGILAQRYGGKHVFGFGIFLTGVLTLLTPFAARMGPGYIIAVRVLEGIGEVSLIRQFV